METAIKKLGIKRLFGNNRCHGLPKKIADVIVSPEADYLLAVKDNQPSLHQSIQNYFSDAFDANFEEYNIDFAETINKGHGRLSRRRCLLGWL